MDSNWACIFIKVLKKGIVSKMRVCLRSLSCVQAHHTVWRKLRQRAEKLVGATDNTHFLCTHSPQRQRHQSCSAEAKLKWGGLSGPPQSVGSLTFIFRVMSLRKKNGFILLVKDRQPFFSTSHQSWHWFHLQIQAGCIFNSLQVHSSDSRHLHLRLMQPIPLWAQPSSTSTEI